MMGTYLKEVVIEKLDWCWKHEKTKDLSELTRNDPIIFEYLRIRLSILQIYLTKKIKHQS